MMPLRPILLGACLALLPAPALAQIGKATAITVTVTGDAEASVRRLKAGDQVVQDETIRTDASGVGQFEFLDRTRLAVGPGSAVKLDKFVYDANRTAKAAAVEVGRGAFRFISGRSPRAAYSISTTTATIGVRGTTFDIYVADSGALCLAALSGSVRVCARGRDCRTHGTVGQYLYVTPDQSYWVLDRWDGSLVGGVTFAAAMPFLANQDRLLPAFRASEAAVARFPRP